MRSRISTARVDELGVRRQLTPSEVEVVLQTRPCTLPPAIAASATYSSCRRPIENALNVQTSGTLLTIAMKVLSRVERPTARPCTAGSSPGRRSAPLRRATSPARGGRCRTTSISGRTPSCWIWRAISFSVDVRVRHDVVALAEVHRAAVEGADLRQQPTDVIEPLGRADQVGSGFVDRERPLRPSRA